MLVHIGSLEGKVMPSCLAVLFNHWAAWQVASPSSLGDINMPLPCF